MGYWIILDFILDRRVKLGYPNVCILFWVILLFWILDKRDKMGYHQIILYEKYSSPISPTETEMLTLNQKVFSPTVFDFDLRITN